MARKKFKNKYRIESNRAQWWDYGNDAAYFFTICTDNRRHFFGGIHLGEMLLSEMGKIAWKNFELIPKQFPYSKIQAFVVMPDHVHCLLHIDKSNLKIQDYPMV